MTATITTNLTPPRAEPIELIALDLDGTVIRSDKRISLRVVDAISRAHKRGIKVVLASARPPRSVRDIHRVLGLDTYQINYNGALIYDRLRGRVVQHTPLEPATSKKMIKFVRKIDPDVIVSLEILDKWYTDHFEETLDSELHTETSRRFAPDFVGPLESFIHKPATKLMFLAPERRMAGIRAAVEKRYLGKVGLAISDNNLLQVIHPNANKAHALADVAAHYGVPQSRVMAVGDAPNDRMMLKWAGLGVALENAWDITRKAADVIAPSNDDDGVAHAIDRYVLA